MSKNTIMAFFLILGSVLFFTSPFYNKFFIERILGEKNQQKKVLTKEKTLIAKEEKETVKNKEIEREKKETGDTIWIENNKMIIGINEMGARIVSIVMKKYKYNNKPIELIENRKIGGAQLTIGNICYDEKMFKYKGVRRKTCVDKNNKKLEFVSNENNGNTIKKIFEINDDDYLIKIETQKDNLPGERIIYGWYCGIEESEKNLQKNQMEKETIHLYDGNNVRHIRLKNNEKEETTGRYWWVGITSKYFFISVNYDSLYDTDIKLQKYEEQEKNSKYKIEIAKIAEKQNESITIYAGPKNRKELIKYHRKYEKVLFPVLGFGRIFFWSEIWFPWLAEMILILLLKIQSIVKDYGISILILTILTRVVTYPMTKSSLKSMERMKDIQPKVNKIRQKHKKDPQKMNKEIMELYKNEGVNPLNPGCLPMFLQMPVFISLFVVLRKAIEIRGEKTVLLPWIKDLSQPEVLISLKKIIPNGIPLYGNNIALLPILMAIMTYYQQKMTIKDPSQKAMIYFMPLFMLALFNSFP